MSLIEESKTGMDFLATASFPDIPSSRTVIPLSCEKTFGRLDAATYFPRAFLPLRQDLYATLIVLETLLGRLWDCLWRIIFRVRPRRGLGRLPPCGVALTGPDVHAFG